MSKAPEHLSQQCTHGFVGAALLGRCLHLELEAIAVDVRDARAARPRFDAQADAATIVVRFDP